MTIRALIQQLVSEYDLEDDIDIEVSDGRVHVNGISHIWVGNKVVVLQPSEELHREGAVEDRVVKAVNEALSE